MPNLRSESEIPKGYFFESDKNISYEIFPNVKDLESPLNTITLIGYGKDNSYIYFRLLDENERLLSLLKVIRKKYCGQDFYQIHKIGSVKRKKGYATYLYNLAVRHCDVPLISDSYLTRPGSYNIWMSLINSRTVSPYEIHYINTTNCTSHIYETKRQETFYWGFDEDMLEVFIDDPENLVYQLKASMNEFIVRIEFYFRSPNPQKSKIQSVHIPSYKLQLFICSLFSL
ncbi:MAG: hypothetical protein IM591_13025 [Chitinophagaceae bacterium]|nr:hypothetical protein [Chitinophagaceae bacterium]